MIMSDKFGVGERRAAIAPEASVPAVARRLVEPFEPMAWAYLSLTTDGVDARATQVRGVVDRLTAASAPAAAVTAVAERLTRAPVAPATVAVFVDADGWVVHEQQLDERSEGPDRAGFSMPPDVLALLGDEQRRPPHVFVAVDRAGADLAYGRGGVAEEQFAEVVGDHDEIRNSAPGGWASLSQSRLRRRAEDSWKHNAFQVADRVTSLAPEVDAQLILVAGEPHVVHHFRARLPKPVADLVHHVPGSRSAQRSHAAQLAKLRASLQQFERMRTDELLLRLHDRLDQDAATQGVEDTVAALAAGRVGLLLIDPTIPPTQTWFGAEPTAIFTTHAEASRHHGPVASGPLAHVAVRSALAAGAEVRVLPSGTEGGPERGIGALCRFRIGRREAAGVETSI